MRMKRINIVVLLVTLVFSAGLATGCGGGGTAPTTSEPSPASAPAESPPATAAPTAAAPTLATRARATPVSLPLDLAKAVLKTKDAPNVRFELATNVTFTQEGKEITQQGINARGEGNGPDQHLTFSGPNPVTGEVETFEMIRIGDRSYIKGLSLGQSMNANVWYELPELTSNSQNSAPNPRGILAGMNETDFLSGDFAATGNDVIDLQPCQVWAAQNTTLARKFGNITNNPLAQSQLTAVDSFELKLWTCTDGYLHQLKGAVSGHNLQAPTEKAKLVFGYHFYDFGANITITAPPKAEPIPVIGPIPTATP